MIRLISSILILSCYAFAQQDAKITYQSKQASVQDIVKTIATQAGLQYNWQKSFDQTDPVCRRWVRDVKLKNVPFSDAMRRILDPVGLRYEVENGSVVLFKTAAAAATQQDAQPAEGHAGKAPGD